ncbi:hypothetical protein GQ42DRAFT_109944, partial [Ramicandelaber brevisporus]
PWASDEDEKLINLVATRGERSWKWVSECMGNRSLNQCYFRWHYSLRPGLVRKRWSPDE